MNFVQLKNHHQPQSNPVNALDILKPKGRHLESLDSERIIYILDQIIKNCHLVSIFDTVFQDLEEYRFLFGRQLYLLFLAFRPHYFRYVELSKKISVAKDPTNISCFELETTGETNVYHFPDEFWTVPLEELKKSASLEQFECDSKFSSEQIIEWQKQLEQNQEEFDKLTPTVQHFIECILVAFRANPHAMDTVIKHREIWHIYRNVSIVNLLKYFQELRNIFFHRMVTTVEERDQKARFFSMVNKQEKNHQQTIVKMKTKLQELKNEKERLTCQMDGEIRALQKEIFILDQRGKFEREKMTAKTKRNIESVENTHEDSKVSLLAELTELKQKYQELVVKNKENELTVRRQKWKLETETENWINKYDNEMSELQSQYDNLKKKSENEQKALEELQKRFEPLDEEYKNVLEERRIQREMEEAERKEQEALVYWATVIQSFWRAWKARKAMRKNRRR